eukprot:992844-Rhodomonas_salina.1
MLLCADDAFRAQSAVLTARVGRPGRESGGAESGDGRRGKGRGVCWGRAEVALPELLQGGRHTIVTSQVSALAVDERVSCQVICWRRGMASSRAV